MIDPRKDVHPAVARDLFEAVHRLGRAVGTAHRGQTVGRDRTIDTESKCRQRSQVSPAAVGSSVHTHGSASRLVRPCRYGGTERRENYSGMGPTQNAPRRADDFVTGNLPPPSPTPEGGCR